MKRKKKSSALAAAAAAALENQIDVIEVPIYSSSFSITFSSL